MTNKLPQSIIKVAGNLSSTLTDKVKGSSEPKSQDRGPSEGTEETEEVVSD